MLVFLLPIIMNKLINNIGSYKVAAWESVNEIINSTKEALVVLWDLQWSFTSEKEYFEYLRNDANFIDILVKHLYWIESRWDLQVKDLEDFCSKLNGMELFQIVDANDNSLYYDNWLPVLEFRRICHGFGEYNWEYNNFHRSSLFIVSNPKGEILLSLRSASKDTYPEYREFGWWHNSLWQDYEQTLKKEISEELWLDSSCYNYKKLWKYRLIQNDKENWQSQIMELFHVKLLYKARIVIDKKELAEYKFFPVFDLVKLLLDENFKLVPHQRFILIDFLSSLWVIFDDIMIQTKFHSNDMQLEKIE